MPSSQIQWAAFEKEAMIMAYARKNWKYFDLKTGSWKMVRSTKAKSVVKNHVKKGNAVSLWHLDLASGKETGSYFCPPIIDGMDNRALLPEGIAPQFSIRSAS